MGHYKSNMRDLQFNLFDVFELDKVLESGEFGDLDHETAVDMLREVKNLSEGVIADSFAEGDRNPPTFDPETHSVTIPEAFKKSYNAYIEAGWDKVGLHEDLGGMPAPRSLYWALGEMVLGANPALFMYSAGAGFSEIFYNNGTDEQKKWAEICAERGWGATMVPVSYTHLTLPTNREV